MRFDITDQPLKTGYEPGATDRRFGDSRGWPVAERCPVEIRSPPHLLTSFAGFRRSRNPAERRIPNRETQSPTVCDRWLPTCGEGATNLADWLGGPGAHDKLNVAIEDLEEPEQLVNRLPVVRLIQEAVKLRR